MSNTTSASTNVSRVIQIKLRTLGIVAAFAVICLFSINAKGNNFETTISTYEYKIVRSESFADIDGVERMMNQHGRDGFIFPNKSVLKRTKAANGRQNYKLDAGSGDFLILRKDK